MAKVLPCSIALSLGGAGRACGGRSCALCLTPPALAALHYRPDSWIGIGLIERGMARQSYDLSLTRYANEGWRATFYVTGREHSATAATASAWEPTPWRAVQGAASEPLDRMEAAA